ncbi:unnamed protein product [Amaranthus hypochondriacus]
MFELKDRMFNRVTHGWFHFMKIKKLTPRDSLVFTLNKSTHECHVGIRRAVIYKVKWHVSPDILKSKPNLQKNMSPWELEVWSSVQETAVPKTNNTSCKKKKKTKNKTTLVVVLPLYDIDRKRAT